MPSQPQTHSAAGRIMPIPSIHKCRYSSFWALASLIRRLHSSLFSALLLHPLNPSSCNASLRTTSVHLVLGLPTGLVVWKLHYYANYTSEYLKLLRHRVHPENCIEPAFFSDSPDRPALRQFKTVTIVTIAYCSCPSQFVATIVL